MRCQGSGSKKSNVLFSGPWVPRRINDVLARSMFQLASNSLSQRNIYFFPSTATCSVFREYCHCCQIWSFMPAQTWRTQHWAWQQTKLRQWKLFAYQTSSFIVHMLRYVRGVYTVLHAHSYSSFVMRSLVLFANMSRDWKAFRHSLTGALITRWRTN